MRRNWDLAIELDLDRNAALPPFLQIARSLAEDIQRGRLRPGDRLPGSRRLALSLGVHRNTVLAALAELKAEGWIETTQGGGTFVASAIPDHQPRASARRLGIRARAPSRVAL